jgi:hypothetical protein
MEEEMDEVEASVEGAVRERFRELVARFPEIAANMPPVASGIYCLPLGDDDKGDIVSKEEGKIAEQLLKKAYPGWGFSYMAGRMLFCKLSTENENDQG